MRSLLLGLCFFAPAWACDSGAMGHILEMAARDFAQGRFAPASVNLEQLLTSSDACVAQAAVERVIALNLLGSMARINGRNKSALRYTRDAVHTAEQYLSSGDAGLLAQSLEAQAQAEAATGHPIEAEPLVRRALEIWQRGGAAAEGQAGGCYNTLAVLHLMMGDAEGARRQVNRSLDRLRGKDFELRRAGALHNLGVIDWHEGKLDESLTHLNEALQLAESGLGSDHPYLAGILDSHAKVLRQLRRKAEARAAERRAASLLLPH